MNQSDIHREVELTLSSLDRITKAKSPVDFAQIITSKMIIAEDQMRWVNRAKFALAATVAMVIINVALLYKNKIDDRQLMLDSIAQEYHLKGDV